MDSTTATAAPRRSEEPDSRNSLRHILATEPSDEGKDDASPNKAEIGPLESADTPTADDDDRDPDSQKGDGDGTQYTSTTTTTRRNANGSVSSVYSGNKIRHLKKDDGIPLWRKDIQYDFLKLVFEDESKVFHKVSDGTGGHTFADIYLDAMAKSSKCSKILKDKLLTERGAAINMAMVCLLVNVGRMNTTLNFFPEMRAQLRTYHAIPSLQAHQDPNAYKQLQDAPRLKSILKGATEDTEQPSTIEDIKNHPIPRTNPVNLIFVLAQFAPKISGLHFTPPRDFFDLVMRPSLSSKSRAVAFLWLMWWYLESNFTKEDAENNPFGPGQMGTDGDGTDGLPIKCPEFKHLTTEEVELENVDTPEEQEFGEKKRLERKTILATDMAPIVTGPKRNPKKAGYNPNPVFSVNDGEGTTSPGRDYQSPIPQGPSRGSRLKHKPLAPDYDSDSDPTRSASPPFRPSLIGISQLLNNKDDAPFIETPAPVPPPVKKGPGRGNWSRNRQQTGDQPRSSKRALDPDGAPGPHGYYLPLNGTEPSHKRSRPITAHQAAVEKYRKERVNYILDHRLRQHYKVARQHRTRDGAIARAWLRCKMMPDGYDTDDDFFTQLERERTDITIDTPGGRRGAPPPIFVGLLPMPLEPDDFGEEAHSRLSVMRKAVRRVPRWEDNLPVVKKKRRPRGAERDALDDQGMDQSSPVRDDDGQPVDYEVDEADEELDDADRELLGEVDADEEDSADDGDDTMVGIEATG